MGPGACILVSLSENSKGLLWWGRGSQLVLGLGTIVPSNQLSETDAREMGHPEPALLPVSDGGVGEVWGAGRERTKWGGKKKERGSSGVPSSFNKDTNHITRAPPS